MIEGHGDDTYRYRNIRLNFSSNIPVNANLSELEEYLSSRMSVIRSYPEPESYALEAIIAHSIEENGKEVIVTSGATEAIYLIAHSVFLSHHKDVLSPSYTIIHPTFSEYEAACQMYGFRDSKEGRSNVCWLCNPNNPTGELYDEAYVRELSAQHDLLVIDQSYEDYTSSPMPSLEGLPNVITLHSMTKKYCVPGLRLGYMVAPVSIADSIRACMRPWSVNALAIEAGLWLLEQPVTDNSALLAETQRLRIALNSIRGIKAYATQTNFILCTIEGHTAAELKDYLVTQHGILIRDASNFRGLTPHHFRVSTQSHEANEQLVHAIASY